VVAGRGRPALHYLRYRRLSVIGSG
jgi:hypothetical protein